MSCINSMETLVDLADWSPVDQGGFEVAQRCAAWPATPQRLGTFVSRSGLHGFASRSSYPDPLRVSVGDSDRRVHLIVWLRGGVDIRTAGWDGPIGDRYYAAGFQPDTPWRTCCYGTSHHVGVLLRPETLRTVAGDDGERFLYALQRGDGLRVHSGAAAMLRAAHDLDTLLLNERSPMLLCEAKCLELLATFLAVAGDGETVPQPSAGERERLHHARALLLHDLASPPTIAELARACGLNTLKLKQGFKALFGQPVYALYQQERMRVAWEMLHDGRMNVTETGTHLGYSNLSHFSAAFRRVHGVSPRAVSRSRQTRRIC